MKTPNCEAKQKSRSIKLSETVAGNQQGKLRSPLMMFHLTTTIKIQIALATVETKID